jgi:hypothetical protein
MAWCLVKKAFSAVWLKMTHDVSEGGKNEQNLLLRFVKWYQNLTQTVCTLPFLLEGKGKGKGKVVPVF